jgi:hypothetical protein
MSNTLRHVITAVAWLFGLPMVVFVLFASGALPTASPLHSQLISVIWGVGLVALFGSWALRDAPAHGKSRSMALGFTAAWVIAPVFTVFLYLFVTRGAKGGAVAALKFMSLCLGFAVTWIAVPRLTAGWL